MTGPRLLLHAFPVPSPSTAPTAPIALRLAAEDDGPRWVEMLRSGVHKSRFVGGTSLSGHDSAEFSVADLHSAARGFNAIKAEGYLLDGKAPVGYDHGEFAAALRMVTGSEPDEGEVYAAAAWVSDVKVEANADGGWSLMGLHHYTDSGRARVRAGGFRGYSIDIAPPGSMQRKDGEPIAEWVPFGGTLTNSPFVQSMAPIAASEAAPVPHKTEIRHMDIKLLSSALALSEDVTEAQALVAIQALAEKAALSDALAANLDRVTSERDAQVAKVAAMSERQKALTVQQAVHDGRIGLSQGADYWDTLTALGEDRAHRIFPAGTIASAPAVSTAAAPADMGDEPATADDAFERAFSDAKKAGADDRTAYTLADEATRSLRASNYLNAPKA
jgi:hypothetical protein